MLTLKALEKQALNQQAIALPFENIPDWQSSLESAGKFATTYLQNIERGQSYCETSEKISGLAIDDIAAANPTKIFSERALGSGIIPTSPRFFGYVPGGGLPTAAIGDFLAAITNRYAGVYMASPPAATIENEVVAWMSKKLSLPDSAWGTLTSGGTTATIAALCVARDQLDFSCWPKLVVYQTEEAHNALEKALRTVGLGPIKHSQISLNSSMQMCPNDLKRKMTEDRRQGLIPWLVYASTGTVNCGAIDPIESLAKICQSESAWLHIDAAYGGFFALTGNPPAELKNFGLADSIVVDPHKGLFQPYGIGTLLVKQGDLLKKSFAISAPYLREVENDSARSPADYSLELTRHFRGLRLWFSLKQFGIAPFVACLEEKLIIAQYVYQAMKGQPKLFELGPAPELSIVTFRLANDDLQGTKTAAILAEILREGKFHLSSTTMNGKYYLRACFLCFRTHMQHAKELLPYLESLIPSS